MSDFAKYVSYWKNQKTANTSKFITRSLQDKIDINRLYQVYSTIGFIPTFPTKVVYDEAAAEVKNGSYVYLISFATENGHKTYSKFNEDKELNHAIFKVVSGNMFNNQSEVFITSNWFDCLLLTNIKKGSNLDRIINSGR